MKIYHIVYEPMFRSLDVHFWTECNLNCQACYTHYEKRDFGLLDNPITGIAKRPREKPPEHFLSLIEVMSKIDDLEFERVIFMGTEPALDPELPALAEALHQRFGSYNIILTNGYKLFDLMHLDEVIFSIKALSERLHRHYTGRSNKMITQNFLATYNSGKKLQAETVLIPGYIDKYEVERIARFIAGIDANIPLRIDAYFPVGDNPWRAATADEVKAAAKMATKFLNRVNYLTLEMKRIGDKSLRIF